MTIPMTKIKVMHIIDSLEIGGAERVAVNLVNALPREEFETFLCTTRQDGPLARLIAPDIKTLSLCRRARYDMRAIFRLASFVHKHQIDILHAHSTSLFVSTIVACFMPSVRVIWHDHYGQNALVKRPIAPYALASKRCNWVISVNHDLAVWTNTNLGFPSENISYVPNFGTPTIEPYFDAQQLPGYQGFRIVYLANLRQQKGHMTLLESLAKVVDVNPKAHLILIGKTTDEAYYQQLIAKSRSLLLQDHITWMGQREDAYAILQQCDISVLSSLSEGMPLVLLEYGFAGLATVATRVGQCPDILAQGQAGLLVEPGDPDELAQAIISLLANEEQRIDWGKKLHQRVRAYYSVEAVLPKIQEIYRKVLSI